MVPRHSISVFNSTRADNQQTHPIIYLIRHGEKPPKVHGKDPDGLSAEGEERAQGLKTTFGTESGYDIQFIIAEHPKKGTSPLKSRAAPDAS